jgi:hypothetical protein
MAKLGVLHEGGLKGWLARAFTGTAACHVFWRTDEFVYEMFWMRRRNRADKYDGQDVQYYDFPAVTQDFLEKRLTADDNVYGVLDFLAFFIKPVLRPFKIAVGYNGGEICSEMTNNDLRACGVETPWADAIPSPADFDKWLFKNNF